jgi:hypothetical protein
MILQRRVLSVLASKKRRGKREIKLKGYKIGHSKKGELNLY